MDKHSVVVIGFEGHFHWACRCSATGNVHSDWQRAFEFASQHLTISAEREAGA